MKEEIYTVHSCHDCPLAVYNYESGVWWCGNYKKLKQIGLVIENNYPKWCPLKKKAFKIMLYTKKDKYAFNKA